MSWWQMASQIYCPVCAAVVLPGAQYCGSCGSRLSAEIPPPEVAEEAPPPAVLGIDYAGFWIRLLAALVDLIPLTIAGLLVQLITEDIVTGLILRILLGATYTIGFWVAADGATPGKLAMGLKVVKSNGEPLDVGTAVLRYLGYAVSAVPLLLGFLMIGVAPQKRALHDYIAQTFVVRVR